MWIDINVHNVMNESDAKPQGSILRSIFFILYTADLLQLVKCHQLLPHAYADDTQIYGFCSPSEVNTLHDQI